MCPPIQRAVYASRLPYRRFLHRSSNRKSPRFITPRLCNVTLPPSPRHSLPGRHARVFVPQAGQPGPVAPVSQTSAVAGRPCGHFCFPTRLPRGRPRSPEFDPVAAEAANRATASKVITGAPPTPENSPCHETLVYLRTQYHRSYYILLCTSVGGRRRPGTGKSRTLPSR